MSGVSVPGLFSRLQRGNAISECRRVPRGYSYEAGTGRPVLTGSASAEEDSSSCHTKEWTLFDAIVLSSRVLDIKDC